MSFGTIIPYGRLDVDSAFMPTVAADESDMPGKLQVSHLFTEVELLFNVESHHIAEPKRQWFNRA
jgi:hypothetical protein